MFIQIHSSTVGSRILLNKEEFYELRRTKDLERPRTIVTFCLLKTRQCIIEGDTLFFKKSKYSVYFFYSQYICKIIKDIIFSVVRELPYSNHTWQLPQIPSNHITGL